VEGSAADTVAGSAEGMLAAAVATADDAVIAPSHA
jgi:hypothetical protein